MSDVRQRNEWSPHAWSYTTHLRNIPIHVICSLCYNLLPYILYRLIISRRCSCTLSRRQCLYSLRPWWTCLFRIDDQLVDSSVEGWHPDHLEIRLPQRTPRGPQKPSAGHLPDPRLQRHLPIRLEGGSDLQHRRSRQTDMAVGKEGLPLTWAPSKSHVDIIIFDTLHKIFNL